MLLTVPLGAAVCASLVGLYPVSLRLTLFAAPLVQLLFVAGLQAMIERLPEPAARRAWVLAGAALACPLAAISLLQLSRDPPEDVRSLVHDLTSHRQEEPVYVFAGSIPPWLFYSTDWSEPDRERLKVVARLAGSGGPAFENAPSRGLVGPGQGVGLAHRSAAGLELYGLPTGIEWTPSLGPLKRTADPGWAETEADRVTALEGGSGVGPDVPHGGERSAASSRVGAPWCLRDVRAPARQRHAGPLRAETFGDRLGSAVRPVDGRTATGTLVAFAPPAELV